MCREACKRDQMAEAWRKAIFNPEAIHSRVMHEVFVPVPRIPSHPVMRHWLREPGGWFGWLRGWWLERRVSRISQALLDSFQGIELIGVIHPRHRFHGGRHSRAAGGRQLSRGITVRHRVARDLRSVAVTTLSVGDQGRSVRRAACLCRTEGARGIVREAMAAEGGPCSPRVRPYG